MSVNKDKKTSRFESNKQLRQIFTRHCVDMSLMTFSCSAHSLTITGTLMKNTGESFTFKGIEYLVEEINRLLSNPSIYSELDNWTISNSTISVKSGKPESNNGQKKAA